MFVSEIQLPTNTRSSASRESDIPDYIENVARRLGARYARNHEEVMLNLDADRGRILAYLGTYFPRTVYEFQTITREMLDQAQIRKTLTKSRAIRVLDLGSGTGGAWIGLASTMATAGIASGLSVDAIDGNSKALSVQAMFATAIADATGMSVQLTTHEATLGLTRSSFGSDLKTALSALHGKYDVVLVSKHLSEFYHRNCRNASGIIQDSLRILSNILTPEGFLIILDVTTSVRGDGEFFPVTMSHEMRDYIVATPDGLKPILPIPCAQHMGSGCDSNGGCYTQRKLEFRHDMTGSGYCGTEQTKVAYRVFTPALQSRRIAAPYPVNVSYRVNANKPFEACQFGRIVNAPGSSNGFVPQTTRN